MTLSITKLQTFLKTNGFLIQKKFTLHDYIIYIEVFNINNADTFLLYIPSKYTIKADDDNMNTTYKLKLVDIDDTNIFKNFNEKIESEDISSNQYNNLSLEIENIKHTEDLEKILKEGYEHELQIKDLNKDDKQNLKDIYYQLSRLTMCVKNIKYKLCIFYKNYLCCIKRDNSLECFIIKDFKYQNERRIYVLVDLENLFQNILNISNNIKKVKEGLYKILNDNQIKNSVILNNILQQKNSIILCSDHVYKKKIEFESYIKNLENLLLKLNASEKTVIEKIFKLKEDKNTNVQNDIRNSHLIYNHEKELENINNVKQEVVKDILNSRTKQENITLEIDKILFDNSVMINIINKNFAKLLEIL